MTALAMTEALSDRDGNASPEEYIATVSQAVDKWGYDLITEAFGTLITTAMSYLDKTTLHHDDAKTAEDNPDQPPTLRIAVPAILTRFRRMQIAEVSEKALPTVAGILTAASLGQDPYEWRIVLGPITQPETLMWCYVAWLIIDFIDGAALEEPGAFAQMLTEIIGAPNDDVDRQ